MVIRGTLRGSMPALLTALALSVLSACGGGGSTKPPVNLSLQGLSIPTSGVVTSVKGMCPIDTQAHAAATGISASYFSGPYSGLHQLASALSSSHGTQSKALLAA